MIIIAGLVHHHHYPEHRQGERDGVGSKAGFEDFGNTPAEIFNLQTSKPPVKIVRARVIFFTGSGRG